MMQRCVHSRIFTFGAMPLFSLFYSRRQHGLFVIFKRLLIAIEHSSNLIYGCCTN